MPRDYSALTVRPGELGVDDRHHRLADQHVGFGQRPLHAPTEHGLIAIGGQSMLWVPEHGRARTRVSLQLQQGFSMGGCGCDAVASPA